MVRRVRAYRLWWYDSAAGVGEYRGNFTDEKTLVLEHSGKVEGRRFRERISYTRVSANELHTRIEQAQAIGAGHVFVLLLRQAYSINVLGRIKECFEMCSIYCATANPIEVIVEESAQGRGLLGVIDGASPRGIEGPEDARHRKEFLRKIGYKP